MIKKTLVLLLLVLTALTILPFSALAANDADEEPILVFEENFEEYEKDVDVASTTMATFFVCDANSIGDGYVRVMEQNSGNLYLQSHVFTQVYNAVPIVGAYEFSVDIMEAQGTMQTGVFVRAPKTAAAYYEADGYPETSTCQAGLLLYTRANALVVNVKTYDRSATDTVRLRHNVTEFALPEGAAYPYTLTVRDTGTEIFISVNGTQICSLSLSDPGKKYPKHESTGKFFATAKLYDASGKELGTYTDPLMSSDGCFFGWTTRAANMGVDNVSVKASKAYIATLLIDQLPAKVTEQNMSKVKDMIAQARGLLGALSDEQQLLVANLDKLTAAEQAVAELDVTTEPETTQPKPDQTTAAGTDTPNASVQQTEAGTEAPDGTTEPEAEVRIIDDSLTVYILIAVMIAAAFAAAGFITVKVRK